jgi:hypothetical protein
MNLFVSFHHITSYHTTIMSSNLAVNLKMVKNILTLIQLVFINSIVYYISLSVYRNAWVIMILVAVSAMKQVCFHYLQVSSQVSPPLPNQINEAAIPIKKNGKMCAVCEVSCKLKCQLCKKVYYCCRQHQLSDWKEHKKICN